MEIKVLDSNRVYYQETNEYLLEINGESHSFRVFDSSDEEPQYWFDGEEFYNTITAEKMQSMIDNMDYKESFAYSFLDF